MSTFGLSETSLLDSTTSVDQLATEEKHTGLLDNHAEVDFFTNLMNLLNALLGAGILIIPSTFDDFGIVPSSIFLILVAVITHFATMMTLILQQKTGSDGMDDIADRILGRGWMYVLSAMILIFNISANLAYLIAGADFLISFLDLLNIDATSVKNRALLTLVYGLLIPIALSIPRSVKFLGIFSTVTIGLIGFYIIAIIIEFSVGRDYTGMKIHPSVKIASFNLHGFVAVGVYGLSFALPMCICPVIRDFTPDMGKRRLSVAISLTVTVLVTIVPSIFAYLEFGDESDGNILNNWSSHNYLMLAVRISFLLVVSFSYPITHVCIAASWSATIFNQNSAVDLYGWKRAFVLFISNIIPLALAMFMPKIKPAVEVGGSLGGCIGNFCFPALMWLVHSEEKKISYTNLLAMLLFAFGISTAIIATYYSVCDAIDAFKYR